MIPPVEARQIRPCESCHCMCDAIPFCIIESKRIFEGNFASPCIYHMTSDEYKKFVESNTKKMIIPDGFCIIKIGIEYRGSSPIARFIIIDTYSAKALQTEISPIKLLDDYSEEFDEYYNKFEKEEIEIYKAILEDYHKPMMRFLFRH